MSEHDFSPLFESYHSIIVRMPDEFSSHQFILRLAQEKQTEYVEALYSYRHAQRQGTPTPFLIVHGVLAQHLCNLPRLVTKIGQVDSTDIFGQTNGCALWRKA
ncbi:hypothetical protein ES702_01886 [subsurface metagenome]